jgi:hypothetical protein
MQRVLVTFYGTVCEKGYVISQLLMERSIIHDFILLDDFILSLYQIRDISGFDRIRTYLESYEYIADICL